MTFKEWLKMQETATTTASIAVFAQPAIGMVRRGYFGNVKKRKKKKRKKH